jgi:hypothetical protein
MKDLKQFIKTTIREFLNENRNLGLSYKETNGVLKEFTEGLKKDLEENGWKVNIVNSLDENENLYFDEKAVNFAIIDSMQMGQMRLKLYVMSREDMSPGPLMKEYHREWDSKENKDLVKPEIRNMSSILSNSSFLFPETQVHFSKTPESLKEKYIWTVRYSVNREREHINKEWLASLKK